MPEQSIHIFWFRRDLRLEDNAGLHAALNAGLPVVPLFIFDTSILDELEGKTDARVSFIYQRLTGLRKQLESKGIAFDIRYGSPLKIFAQLPKDYSIKAVFTNHDYEPYATERDSAVKQFLQTKGISFQSFKDQVIFERSEVVKNDGKPYLVFTPYSKKWLSLLNEEMLQPQTVNMRNFFRQEPRPMPSLEKMDFVPGEELNIQPEIAKEVIRHYDRTRDIPSLPGTSRMGVHLRFGTISVRQLVKLAQESNRVFLGELIWREFFMQMLWHFPRLVNEACKTEYDRIRWRNNEKEFERWCQGQTGYPIVDAGMRELNETGFMHNRVRMIAASFLVKHLLIDWRWGEAYFAKKLLDYELSSNNGNWQWVAGCGCDAAPYFRIFNPYTQTKRFDPKHNYIKKWVPEYESSSYPAPIVDHELARERCLKTYKQALRKE